MAQPEVTKDRIRDAAFAVFAEQGYEATSVAEIVAAAGVARSTFFRLFGSKDAVVFPDHEALVAQVEQRLTSSTADSALAAIADAVRLVLFHYVSEGERARARYRLTSSVSSLRQREFEGGAQYQRLFRHVLSRAGNGSELSELRAEMAAAAVVAAHNRVLRRWLRRECNDPQHEIDGAMDEVLAALGQPSGVRAVLVALPNGVSPDEAARAIKRATWQISDLTIN